MDEILANLNSIRSLMRFAVQKNRQVDLREIESQLGEAIEELEQLQSAICSPV